MTTADLKRAFMDERPVRYNGITYQRVTAVIYRKTPDKTGLLVQGELLDNLTVWHDSMENCWTRTDVPL